MKTKKPSRLKRIAYHEAGHAVVMHHFGDEIDELSIKPNINRSGGVKPKKADTKNSSSINPDEISARIKKCAIGFLGGLAAEHIYNGEPNKIKTVGSMEDLKNVQELCRAFNIEVSCQDLIDQFFDDAMELLKEKWETVEALSKALIQKGTITGEEATNIIEKYK